LAHPDAGRISLALASSVTFILLSACGGGEAPAALSEAAVRGKTVFMEQCSGCHGIGEIERGAAPDLNGLLGRKVGSQDFHYSAAMAGSDRIWSPELLEAFLTSPQEEFPGNQMVFYGMEDPSMRGDLVSFVAVHSPG